MVLQRRYKHFNRLRYIANAFARQGLGYLLDNLGIREVLPRGKRIDSPSETVRLTRGERVRLVFEELGPAFIKLGQVLSTRPDVLPADVVRELERLQDDTTPVSFSQVKETVVRELGADLDELFVSFEESPLASASIAQVHGARLASGREVVVKVQRPNIRQVVEIDLEIMYDVARLADRRTTWGEKYRLLDLVEEFARSIRSEMDFRIEGHSAERFRRNFRRDPRVTIPEVFWDHSTARVLTLERLQGVKLSNLQELETRGVDKRELAGDLARVMLKQILVDGFFHGDPHPGNIFVVENGSLGFMDFGIVGSLTGDRKRQLAGLILALVQGSGEAILRSLQDMGIVPVTANREQLKLDLERLRQKYYDRPAGDVRIGPAFSELLELSFKYGIQMPREFVLLSKSLVITEGVVRQLDPNLSLMEVVAPFARVLLRNQFSLENLKAALRNDVIEYGQLISEFPRLVRGLRERLEQPEVHSSMRIEGFERGLSKLDKIVNRLSFSVILLAFSILMAGLIISSALGGPAENVITRFPVFEVGFIMGATIFVWLIVSIFRSGRF